jgi:cell shape-determining protein MreD
MRWAVFLGFAFLVLVLDGSLVGALTLWSFAPHLPLVLVVFIGLFAARFAALVGAVLLGLVMDLTLPLEQGIAQPVVYVIGPHALGFAFAAYVVLQVRTLVFRQRVVTVAVLSFAAVMAAGTVVIAIYLVRSWYGEGTLYFASGSAARELARHAAIGLYTAIIALPLGWLLLASTPLWGFHSGLPRRSSWR